MTQIPRSPEFQLTCPRCRQKSLYSWHAMVDNALEQAVLNHSMKSLNIALGLGADPEYKMAWHGLALTPAAFAVTQRHRPGRYALMRRLVEEKADLDVHDENDRTLLIHTILNGDLKMFELLLSCGASPHAPSECADRIYPLHAAFMCQPPQRHLEFVTSLLAANCSPQVYDGRGLTPLKYAYLQADGLATAALLRALNWHQYAPESLRPRRPPMLLPASAADPPRPAHPPADFSRPHAAVEAQAAGSGAAGSGAPPAPPAAPPRAGVNPVMVLEQNDESGSGSGCASDAAEVGSPPDTENVAPPGYTGTFLPLGSADAAFAVVEASVAPDTWGPGETPPRKRTRPDGSEPSLPDT